MKSLWPGVPALARRSVASVGAIVSRSAYWSWGAYFSSISPVSLSSHLSRGSSWAAFAW